MEKKVRDLIINLTLLDPESAIVVEELQKENEKLKARLESLANSMWAHPDSFQGLKEGKFTDLASSAFKLLEKLKEPNNQD
jgi:hypothetical protein